MNQRLRDGIMVGALFTGAISCSSPEAQPGPQDLYEITGYAAPVDAYVQIGEWKSRVGTPDRPTGDFRNYTARVDVNGCKPVVNNGFSMNVDDPLCEERGFECESIPGNHCEPTTRTVYDYDLFTSSSNKECLGDDTRWPSREEAETNAVEDTECIGALTPNKLVKRTARYVVWISGGQFVDAHVEITEAQWLGLQDKPKVTPITTKDGQITDLQLAN